MNRRVFLLSAAAGVLPAWATPNSVPRSLARRGLSCSPFDRNGVQQCEAGIDSSILDVVASDTQHASEWCWAACIQAVFAYYGHSIDQEQIVEQAYGDVLNLPGTPQQILSALNRQWTDSDGREFVAQGNTLSTNAITAAQDLASNHPLIIGALGHAMVLTSLTYFRNVSGQGNVILAEVRDPWPYNPRHRPLSPDEWYSISFAARIRVTDA
jgi:hypothetical protein